MTIPNDPEAVKLAVYWGAKTGLGGAFALTGICSESPSGEGGGEILPGMPATGVASIPTSSEPLRILKKPASPQLLPQEFATSLRVSSGMTFFYQ